MSTDEQTYAFRNARAAQRGRLETLETLLDGGTIRLLDARGVAPGWRCLEVGAGGGSIARWLAARVGPEGFVLATDLDTSVCGDIAAANVEVRVHAVLRERHVFEPFYGRQVAGDLLAAGLVDVGCDGRAGTWRGGGPGGLVWRLSLEQLRDGLIAGGHVGSAVLDAAAAALEDPQFSFMSQVTMAAWGRRPVA